MEPPGAAVISTLPPAVRVVLALTVTLLWVAVGPPKALPARMWIWSPEMTMLPVACSSTERSEFWPGDAETTPAAMPTRPRELLGPRTLSAVKLMFTALSVTAPMLVWLGGALLLPWKMLPMPMLAPVTLMLPLVERVMALPPLLPTNTPCSGKPPALDARKCWVAVMLALAAPAVVPV